MMKKAMELSMQNHQAHDQVDDEEQEMIKRAMALSLKEEEQRK